MKRFVLSIISLSLVLGVYSQISEPQQPAPVAYVTNAKGEESELAAGDNSFSGEAPVVVNLYANAEEVEGFSLVCQWEFKREGETEPYLVRHDADVVIDIKESGTTIIQPVITYTSTSDSEIYYRYDDVELAFRITLSESSLGVPNAFSPNGDGINDYFNVYNAKSLIKFSAAIFNRWGQKLYSWGLDEVGCEGCGWDGTYNGHPVKAGVYYVVVKAKGADGIEYDFRRDVNLLRGYNESGE